MDNDVIQAVAACDAETLKILLSHGANAEAVDSKGWSALRRTALSGCHSAATVLLAHGASVEFGGEPHVPPLIVATANDQTGMVKLLLAHGAEVDAYCDQAGLCRTPLTAAALYGHTDVVRLLLDHAADPNKRGYRGQTALFCWKPDVVRLLLEHEADVNIKDEYGDTALTSALHELHHEEFYEGMQEVVDLLQEASKL